MDHPSPYVTGVDDEKHGWASGQWHWFKSDEGTNEENRRNESRRIEDASWSDCMIFFVDLKTLGGKRFLTPNWDYSFSKMGWNHRLDMLFFWTVWMLVFCLGLFFWLGFSSLLIFVGFCFALGCFGECFNVQNSSCQFWDSIITIIMFEFFDLTQYLERCFFSFEQLGFIYLAHFFLCFGWRKFPQDSFFFDRASRFSRKETILERTPRKTSMSPEK